MPADAWVMHDSIKEYIGDGTVDLDADSFRINLYLVTSDIATTSENAIATITNQHASANGYTQDTEAINAPTWVESAGTVTFDVSGADPAWTASTGSIIARFAGIYDDTVTTPVIDPLVCHSLLDNSPDDVTVTDGNTLTIQMNASGVFTVA